MATKPTTSTEWAVQFTTDGGSGNPNKQVPTTTFKNFGQPEAIPTDRQGFNYILNSLHLWRVYFEEMTDDSVQIGDNVSLLVNDANYTSEGDNVSVFVNDAGYLTEADLTDDFLKAKAVSKADFFARAEQRKRDNAGSGFLEWGTQIPTANLVNEGLECYIGVPNYVGIGRIDYDNGVSRTNASLALVDGVQHRLEGSAEFPDQVGIDIKFPPAPDGTKTYDSATGVVTTYANPTLAFAAETATNKVITSRKDLVFLETFHEAIKNQVYYLGNTQLGGTNPYGISQSTRNDGYTRFGEWDTTTTGNFSDWSTMTNAEKLKFIEDPDNNIYYDAESDKFIQVRYRIRVIEGLGDQWGGVSPFIAGFLSYQTDFAKFGTILQRGQLTDPTDLVNLDAGGRYGHYINPSRTDDPNAVNSTYVGAFKASGLVPADGEIAYNGLAFALPIALVQRLNQGAFSLEYNSTGAATKGGKYPEDYRPISTLDCFTGQSGGSIASATTGRSNQYEFYDAIYAGLVEDLRLPAAKLDVDRLLRDKDVLASASEMRGKGKVPFTKVFSSVGAVEAGYVIKDQTDPTAVLATNYDIITAEYDSLPYVDLLGSPTNIAATFPDGVVGDWISELPDGTIKTLNRKSLKDSSIIAFTDNLGASWTSGPAPVNQVTNESLTTLGVNGVMLINYESHANFTEPSLFISTDTRAVGDVWFGTYFQSIFGNRKQESLTGYVGTNSSVDKATKYVPLSEYNYRPDTKSLDYFNKNIPEYVYNPLTASTANNSAGVKALSSLVQKDGLYYLQYNGSELRYNSSSFDPWGDDCIIPIVDNEGIDTDTNGNTIKTFCHVTMIPVGIADYTLGGE